MINVLHGNAIDYEIDELVARGQESIVYKARVKSTQRCVALKFRQKEGLGKFRKKELPVYQSLDHLNIIKIFDYIVDIGTLRLDGEKDGKFVIDRAGYYCVIEDFVTGAPLIENKSSSLYYYCKEKSPSKEAKYQEVIDFQADYIFKWIFEFCDIMTHMTRENRILHLDIKPENIMVTRTGSIILIDMGLSDFIEEQSSGINLQITADNSGNRINAERRYIVTADDSKIVEYVRGTPGFAAPECYYKDGKNASQDENLKNPFGLTNDKECVADIKSDIFSFGCVLWDVIHLGGYGGDIKGKNKDYATLNKHETKDGYFLRDLHYASPYYLQELEDIILKCTEENPERRFQDYDELRAAAENAKKNLPKSDENTKKSKILRRVTLVTFLISLLLLVIWQQGLGLGYELALQDFRRASENYSEHTLGEFRDILLSLLEEASNANVSDEPILRDILSVVLGDGNRITSREFELLRSVLGNRNVNDSITHLYIDTAMQNPVAGNDINTLSIAIARNFAGADSAGFLIAEAIANRNTNPMESYETLIEHQNRAEYNASLNHLARNLLTIEAIRNNPDLREEVERIVNNTQEMSRS